MQRRSAFTLIELLVAAAIGAMVVVALAAAFASGLSVWDRVRNADQAYAQAMLGLGVFERDIHNAFTFYEIPFACQEDAFTFPALLPAHEGADPAPPRIATCEYRFTGGAGGLRRAIRPYGGAPASIPDETLLENVAQLSFAYFHPQKDNPEAFEWVSSLTENEKPRGVRVALVVMDGTRKIEINRIVYMRPLL